MNEITNDYINLIITYPNDKLITKIKSNANYKNYSEIIMKDIIDNMDNAIVLSVKSAIAMNHDIKGIDNKIIYKAICKYLSTLDICNEIILYIYDNNRDKWNRSPLDHNDIAEKIFSRI